MPDDRGFQDLVGELSTQSDTFRRLWADHNVRTHGAGTKRFDHPVVGELTLAYEELAITAEPGLGAHGLHRRARLADGRAAAAARLVDGAVQNAGGRDPEHPPHGRSRRPLSRSSAGRSIPPRTG
jgi:hypothetical protein